MTKFVKQHIILIPILFLAAFLRLYEADTEFFGGDDAYISIKAIQVARYGETHLLGPPSSLGLVHSPLSVYLYAIPYLFSPDPRGAQAFTGILNVVAVGILYFISHRYFGRWAAIIGSVLFAVHPHMVFASRVINNAQLGAPLVMLYVFTGLLGYFDNKGWARLTHLSLLSLAGQCHPHSFALAPISVALIVYCWINSPKNRRVVLSQTLVGAFIAVVTLVPWGIGLYQFSQNFDVLGMVQNMPSTGELQDSVGFGGLGYIFSLSYNLERVPRNWLQPVQAAIVVAGTLWFLFRALRYRNGFPGLIIVLGLIIVPAVTWIIQAHWVVDYWWPRLPNAFLIQGAVIAAVVASPSVLSPRSYLDSLKARTLKWPVVLLTLALGTNQVWDYFFADRPPPPVTSRDLVTAMDIAVNRVKEDGRELMVLLSPGHNGLTWALLREYAFLRHGLQADLVQSDSAVPLPDKGALLVGDASNENRDFWFAGGEMMSGRSRLADLPAAEHFSPDLVALSPLRFSNDVIVRGFFLADPEIWPLAGQRWSIFMIWEAGGEAPQAFNVFTHLVGPDGNKYGQGDRRGFDSHQWRHGSLYASQFELDLADDLPETGSLFLRFGMYTSDDQAELLDNTGNPAGTAGEIQIRAETLPVAVWSNGLELNSFEVSSPIQTGSPINASVIWRSRQEIEDKLQLRWQLFDEDNLEVFSSITAVISEPYPSAWAQGVFVAEKYELRVPSDIAPGDYRIEVQTVDQKSVLFDESFSGVVEVTDRLRNFAEPSLKHVVRAVIGDEIEVLGYDLERKADNLELTVFWRALGYINQDYKYFVHLWKGEQVVAQVDSMPASWQYPTSWWAPGEVVAEKVVFDVADLESDGFGVTTGFYDPEDGGRLKVARTDGAKGDIGWVTLIESSDE